MWYMPCGLVKVLHPHKEWAIHLSGWVHWKRHARLHNMLHCTVLLRFYKRSIVSSHSPESAYIATSNKVGEHIIHFGHGLRWCKTVIGSISWWYDAWFGSFIFLFNDCFLNKAKIYTIVPKHQNKRPMSHIAHLRKQFKSINTYDYIITLIKRRKKNIFKLMRIYWLFIWRYLNPYHPRMLVPRLFEISSVIF